MSIAIIERQASHELLVNTSEDVLLLCAGLNNVIAQQRLSQEPDEQVLQKAESLREQVGEDVLQILSGAEVRGASYTIDDSSFALEALSTVKKQANPVSRVTETHQPLTGEYNWLFDADNTRRATTVRPNFNDF